jgi:nicotinamidase-related amidase
MNHPYPVPEFFNPTRADKPWHVDYETRARQAAQWAREYGLLPASQDKRRVWMLLVDMQNTFCLPDFELFVAGRSGRGAVEDTIRLCQFIYSNLGSLTHITATLDTHTAMQIFHSIFLVDEAGAHPQPYSLISAAQVREGQWKFNPLLADQFDISPDYGQEMLLHYVSQLEKHGKYDLTVWPYHAMLGGAGHALVPSIEEALFFHTIARRAQTEFDIKGRHPFTENYSVIGPEVLTGPMGEALGGHNHRFIEKLKNMDALIVAGQAKSHCVAWTLQDLLEDINETDPSLVGKVYLLEDCTSPVVVPGADYSDSADQAFARFAEAGMHRVKSTDPLQSWEDFPG